jgi:hypothetical protein
MWRSEFSKFTAGGFCNGRAAPNYVGGLKQVLCKDYEYANTNVVDWLIGNRSIIWVQVVLKDPDPRSQDLEFPQLAYEYWFAQRGEKPERADPTVANKISIANPGVVYKDVSVECVPEAVECVSKEKQPQQATPTS